MITVFLFTSQTCPHCGHQKETLKELAKERNDFEVVENDPQALEEIQPKSVPTIVLYKEGKQPEGVVGHHSKGYLSELMDKLNKS